MIAAGETVPDVSWHAEFHVLRPQGSRNASLHCRMMHSSNKAACIKRPLRYAKEDET